MHRLHQSPGMLLSWPRQMLASALYVTTISIPHVLMHLQVCACETWTSVGRILQVSRLLGDIQCVPGTPILLTFGDNSSYQGRLPCWWLLPLPVLRHAHHD